MTEPQVPGDALLLPAALHPLVRLLLARSDLQQKLGRLVAVDAFIAEAMALAAAHGVAVDEAALRAVLRPDPLGLGRFGPAPVTLDGWPPAGWLPARSVPTGAAPAFDWLWFGDAPLTAPFFEDAVRRAGALPLNWLLRIRTGLAALVTGAARQPALPLHGLIFHMSRCGSTLLAQMLGAVPGHAVSSEPEPLDAVLRWIADAAIEPEPADAAIRGIVAALGRRRNKAQQRHFIKLEVWHSLFLPELRRALPEVTWVYLHRDPVEVLVSLAEQPSLHVLPGALSAARLAPDGFEAASPADYAAWVIGRSVQAAVAQWPLGGGLAVDYPLIASTAPHAIANHFGLALEPGDRTRMSAAGQRDAKDPKLAFAGDSERKRGAATPEILAAAQRWLVPVRDRLLQLK